MKSGIFVMKKLFLILLLVLIFIFLFIGPYFKEQAEKQEEIPMPKYPPPSTYYAMDNVHETAVRPGGKELYLTSIHVPLILVVDIDSADYPVLGEIKLPGGDLISIPDIVFSADGKHAYMARNHNEDYIASWGLENASYIVIINTEERKIEHIISLPYRLGTSLALSPDSRWLYFTIQPNLGKPAGIGKLDLRTEEVVEFLPLGYNSNLFITLSDNGNRIYTTQGEHPPGSRDNFFKVIDAKNLKIISSLEVGEGPRYVAISPDGTKAYVSNQWSNSISVINLSTMKVITTLTVGLEPREIAITPDGSKAYVALPGVAQMMAGGPGYLASNSVAVLDTKQDILLTTIQVHFDPEGVAMDPDGTKVYAGDGGCNGPQDPAKVDVIDTANDTYLRPIMLRQVAQYAPAGIDITPDNSRLFVTSFPKKTLLVIDIATSKIIKELYISPQAVKVSADGSKVYAFSPASDKGEAKLFIIDSNSLKIMKSIGLGKTGCLCVGPIPSYRIVLNSAETMAYINYETIQKHIKMPPEWVDPDDTGLVAVDLVEEKAENIFYSENPDVVYKGLALTPDEAELFVSDPATQSVVIIDAKTHKQITKIPVAQSPSEIKISGDGKRAYILQQFGTLMTIIDVDTHKLIKRIDFPSGGIHAQMDFELSPDERYVYAAGFDSNFVLVYDLHEGKVVKVIDTGLDPLLTAITSDGHYIYVSEVTGDKISVIDTTTNSLVRTVELGK